MNSSTSTIEYLVSMCNFYLLRCRIMVKTFCVFFTVHPTNTKTLRPGQRITIRVRPSLRGLLKYKEKFLNAKYVEENFVVYNKTRSVSSFDCGVPPDKSNRPFEFSRVRLCLSLGQWPTIHGVFHNVLEGRCSTSLHSTQADAISLEQSILEFLKDFDVFWTKLVSEAPSKPSFHDTVSCMGSNYVSYLEAGCHPIKCACVCRRTREMWSTAVR